MMSDDIAIKISDVHVSFGNHHVLKGASGEIKKGSIVTFLGRSRKTDPLKLKGVHCPAFPPPRWHRKLLSCLRFMKSHGI